MKNLFKSIITLVMALTISLSSFCIVCAEPSAGSAEYSDIDEDSGFFVDENGNKPYVPMYFTYNDVQYVYQVVAEWGAMDFVFSPIDGWKNSFSIPDGGTISNNEIKITNKSTIPIRVSYELNIDNSTYTDLDIDDGDADTTENIGFRVTTENKNGLINEGDTNTVLSFGYPEQNLNALGEEGNSGSVYVTVENENPTINGTYDQTEIGSITVSVYPNS